MKKTTGKTARLGALALTAAMAMNILTMSAGAAGVNVNATLSPQVNIVVDGAQQTFYNAKGQEVHPLSYNNSNYLPVRAIGELMNKTIGWDEATLTLTISGTRDGARVSGTPDTGAARRTVTAQMRQDFTIVVDGATRTFTDANGARVYPLLYDGSTYLPLRAVGELMGATVGWDNATSTVTLVTTASTNGQVTDADQFGTGTTQTGNTTYIGEGKAKEIALKHAGLTASQVTFVHTYLEQDDGRWEYDVEFYTKDYKEYDYAIDAYTGVILSFDYDADEYTRPDKTGNGTTSTANYIGEAKAKSIAISRAGVSASNIYDYSCSLDYDDGVAKYEIDFKSGNYEYEVDVDATSGKVLKFEKDWD